METDKYFEQIISGEELSFEQKLEIIKDMVHPKVHKALQKHVVIAKATWEEILFSVTTDDNQDIWIKRYLKIIGATDVDILSENQSWTDMWWYTENWVRTSIQFKI